ncbi:flagellar biosynthetic protein FliQ [Thermodesulfitimonas autotrophica]|uniref:flagellar biosynthetic protein FliQ n=1 Tax=Thermodesulfitimonas autotrophica TaxID=1894989 RepID=UPI002FE0FD78
MSQTLAVNMVNQALLLVLVIAGPVLLVSMLVGFVISILQATTQIQDQMISFVPKILAVFLTLIVFFPLFIRLMIDFTTRVFGQFPAIMQ